MMKFWLKIIGICSCFLPALVEGAVNDLLIDCRTPWPTTSIFAQTTDGKVSVRVTHHNGVESAPIYSGPVTSSDLPLLQADADAFKKLGNEWSFQWETSKCSASGENMASCDTGPQSDFQGQSVKSASFRTSRLTEESTSGVVRRVKFQLMLMLNNSIRQMSLEYAPEDCLIRAR